MAPKVVKCVINTPTIDELDGFRALVLARAHMEKDPRYSALRKKATRELTRRSRELQKLAKINGCLTLTNIHKVQYVFPYQITIFPSSTIDDREKRRSSNACFRGCKKPKGKVYLIFNRLERKFAVITNIRLFYKAERYCHICETPYQINHICFGMCSFCKKKPPCSFINSKPEVCQQCQLVFLNSKCKAQHECSRIPATLSTPDHDNGGRICNECGARGQHLCFTKPYEPPLTLLKNPSKLIFFDFETIIQHGSQNLVPILCIAHRLCETCTRLNLITREMCPSCQCVIFEGQETLSEFTEWLFSPGNKHAVAISHNGKAFDTILVLQEIVRRIPNARPKVIMQQAKCLSLTWKGVKLIDSRSFVSAPLAKLPQMFGVDDVSICKGFFPHGYYDSDNLINKIGRIPPITAFGNRSKTDPSFRLWYDQRVNAPYNPVSELRDYCEDDVVVLRVCLMIFRKHFIRECGGIDPLLEAVTLAQACHLVFRKLHLNNSKLAVIPHHYSQDVHSTGALLWLSWVEHTENLNIRHARNGGEIRLGLYKIDGFCKSTNTCFEFNGCFHHGCPRCYPKNWLPQKPGGLTFQQLYANTLRKEFYITHVKKYNLRSIWECEFQKLREKSSPLQKHITTSTWRYTPLKPGDGLYGGRTEVFQLYWKNKEGSENFCHYVDYCSLYPYICKYGVFGVGHPDILTQSLGNDISKWFGLIKCQVLAPTDLLIPLLPYRAKGKLLFGLCRTCCELEKPQACIHQHVNDRAFTGTWVSLELQEAVKLGYKILNVFEVWHFSETTQYDPTTKKGGFFAEYIQQMLSIKIHASGWPSDDPGEREHYMRSYWEREQIKINPELVEKNISKRTLGKTLVNCLWGKMAQRSNLNQTEYLSDGETLLCYLEDPKKVVHSIVSLSDTVIQIQWSRAEEFIENHSSFRNVVVAAFVTAQARLHLYKAICQVQGDVLYVDTDSVIFTSKQQTPDLPTGQFLGDLTSELEIDETITEFVSTGPKSYAFCTSAGREVLRLKGIPVNVQNYVGLKTLKKLVFDVDTPVVKIPLELSLRRTAQHDLVQNLNPSKSFSLTLDKRLILENRESTLPFGYLKPSQ